MMSGTHSELHGRRSEQVGSRQRLLAWSGTAIGTSLEQRVQVTLSDERTGIGTADTYACSEIDAERISGGETDA